MSLRDHLLSIYQAGLAAVDGRACVHRALQDQTVDTPVYVIAIGKAAPAMLQGALDVLADRLRAGLLITKHGYAPARPLPAKIDVFEAGHPWPDQASLDAGEALLRFIDAAPADARVVFLVSGGTSSLVEVLPEGMALSELHKANDWLLGSGLDIHVINYVRKALSCIKSGRLAQRLQGRPTRLMLISDVPGDDPATIGSGLLVPEILLETEAPWELPGWLEALMERAPPAPEEGDECFDNIETEIVASLGDATRAAAQQGRVLGYEVYEHHPFIGGDALLVGRRLAAELLQGPKVLHVWGGETTVRLPHNPGRGGRNQHLALSAAIELDGRKNVALLAAATDGTDGPTQDAGAVVDGVTVRHGRSEGLDARRALSAANAGAFLAASGALIQTGPTGTNVMDLMLGIKQ